MVFSGLMFFPSDVEAKKSSGTQHTEVGSDKVCGIKLCIVPLTIEEKISAFFGTKSLIAGGGADQQIGRFSDSGVLQQSAGTDFNKPAQKASGTYLTEIGSQNVCGDKLCIRIFCYFLLALCVKCFEIIKESRLLPCWFCFIKFQVFSFQSIELM